MAKTYRINEIFYSPQGEGVRAGTMNVFVRFSKCNLKCTADGEAGFDCDAEYESGQNMALEEIFAAVREASYNCKWLVLTGGEPALQVDNEFCDYFHAKGYKLAIETNGTVELPHRVPVFGGFLETEDMSGKVTSCQFVPAESQPDWRKTFSIEEALSLYHVDWICVSPKSAEHTIRQPVAHEVKYVRNADQALPKPSCKALHYVLSPAFAATTVDSVSVPEPGAVKKCLQLCRENPDWRFSYQLHKLWRVR